MAKKKNYVTRDKDGTVIIWAGCKKEPARNIVGDYHMDNTDDYLEWDYLEPATYKAFIGKLPRKGSCTEWRKK